MHRTTIMLPAALRTRALQQAEGLGISLGELIRRSLVLATRHPAAHRKGQDPLFTDARVFRGPAPRDLSRRHDRYLYGEGSS